jgi:DNA-binding SARP family transcriptional activator
MLGLGGIVPSIDLSDAQMRSALADASTPIGNRMILNLLGRFGISERGTSHPVRISTHKGRGLLAYCAMQQGRGVSRDFLATLLWGDRFDKHARQSLRQCLLTLRTELGEMAELLVVEGDEVRLRTEYVFVDADAFAALADASELPDLERAAGLYRGQFVADLAIQVEPFDEWVQAERTRLDAIAARVLNTCAERFEVLGRSAEAIEAAERLVALDPLREDHQRRLLVMYARYRGREAALVHARVLTGLLNKELDADPDPETIGLIETIKNGAIVQVTSASAPTASLPETRQAPKAESADERTTRRHHKVVQWLRERPAATLILSVALAALITGSIAWSFASSRPANVAVLREDQLDGVPVPMGTKFEYQRYAPAGQEILIGSHSAADKNCVHDGFPVIAIMTPPAHGTISTRERPVIMSGQRRFYPTHCRGVSNTGIGVHYQPAEGFVGVDRVAYRVSYRTPPITHYDLVMEITVFPVSASR